MTERPHRRLCPTDDAREVPGAISGGCFSLPFARAEIQLKIAARSNLFVNTNAGARECRTNCWPRSHPSQWAAGSPFSALLSAQLQRNPPQLACRADPSTQGNPGSVWNYRTYPPALNSTARLLQTVAELPGSRFQPCAPRAPFLPTSQARAAGMPATTTSFWPGPLRLAQVAGTESVDFA